MKYSNKIVAQQVEAYNDILNGENSIENYGDIIIEHDKAVKDEIKKIFARSELVTSVNTDKVDIGTVTTVIIDKEVYEVVLVETNVIPVSTSYGFVSLESPLGNAIYGLSVGDTFSYPVEKEIVSGAVVALNSDYTLSNVNSSKRAK